MMITINYLIINYPTPMSIKIRSIGYKYVNVQIYKCLLQNYLIECSHFLGNYLSMYIQVPFIERKVKHSNYFGYLIEDFHTLSIDKISI